MELSMGGSWLIFSTGHDLGLLVLTDFDAEAALLRGLARSRGTARRAGQRIADGRTASPTSIWRWR